MALAKTEKDAGMIEVANIVSNRTGEPIVQIRWGEKEGQLSVYEARQHALMILECAEAAESDAFVFAWLMRDIIGTEDERKAELKRVVTEFVKFRAARTKILGVE